MPRTPRRAVWPQTAAWILAGAMWGPVAHADDIDRAFATQKKPSSSRTEVKTDVRERAAEQATQVRDRALELEAQARREREAALRDSEASPARDGAGDKGSGKADGKAGGQAGARARATGDRRQAEPVVIRESWPLAGEMKSLVVRCPSGAERSYTWHPKTGRYCTPSMTCNTSQDWIHRALC